MKHQIVGNVYVTSDYGLFKFMNLNRDVDEKHVNELIRKFSKKYEMTIVIINKDFEVIDGQHRITAAQRLGLPIHYFINNSADIETVKNVNSTNKTWKGRDFLKSNVAANNSHYLAFAEFEEEFGFKFAVSTMLLGNSTNNLTQDFKDGVFQVRDLALAKLNAQRLVKLNGIYDGACRGTFVRAFLKLVNHSEFSFDRFMDKLGQQPLNLVHCLTVDGYVELMLKIYNHGARGNSRFKLE